MNAVMKPTALRPFGFAETLALGEYQRADRLITAIRALGCQSLRLSVSDWDYYAPGGEEWYGWLFRCVSSEVELLPCLYSASFEGAPPSSASGALNGVHDYADFVDAVLTHHGKHFTHVELCIPPPTNRKKQLTREAWLPSAEVLTTTLQATRGWNIVLGTPVTCSGHAAGEPRLDLFWVHALGQRGLLDEVSAFSIQKLFEPEVVGYWEQFAATLRDVLQQYGSRACLWLTDGGYPSEPDDDRTQADQFTRFLDIPAERHYWREWQDRPGPLDSSQGLGMFHADGRPKRLGRLLQQNLKVLQAAVSSRR